MNPDKAYRESYPPDHPTNNFLIEEYKNAAQLTYHIDELRNKLTSFFLTFTGLATTGLIMLLKGEAETIFFEKPEEIVTAIFLIIGFIGIMMVCILARLRKVQIEHFRIINNIRSFFLDGDYNLWNIVQLSSTSLPIPSRKSGTYYWLIVIILVSSLMLAFAVFLFDVYVFKAVSNETGYWIFIMTVVLGIFLQDNLYFLLSSSSQPYFYSAENLPCKES